MTAPNDHGQDAPLWEEGDNVLRFPVSDEGRAYAEAVASAKAPAARPQTASDVVAQWAREGPVVRAPTGFPTLDEACRGGLPIPWRVLINGAPSAGKTALAMVLAYRLEAAGLCVGILGIDEEPEDHVARFAQMAGYTVAQCDGRDPEVMAQIRASLASLRIRFYDGSHTVEEAMTDLGEWAAKEKRRAVFVLDTVQTARTGEETSGPREQVETCAKVLRAGVAKYRMMLIALSEANRNSYRSEESAAESNDMASGAESRAIEFSAQTLMMLRTPKDHPNIVHVRVPKNRKGALPAFEFFLRLDRDRHELVECGNPADEHGAAEEATAKKRTANIQGLERVARDVLRIIASNPGIGERGLRAALTASGAKVGVNTLDAVEALLLDRGLVENRPEEHGKRAYPHFFATNRGAL